MEHLIKLLPDHIANQIAAGEVVQRPASVVKELLENSIDAGATEMHLIIKDAGKNLIQVVDNGCGMNAQDARMCFERHATSKIRTAEDLFDIRTMGFRGEAMASIAAVAQITLKTRLHSEELGTEVIIEGSDIKSLEPTLSTEGSSIAVRNLFYNVPARRNFLKSNPVETRHIINEFIRVALANPGVKMTMDNNGTPVYSLKSGGLKQRICEIFGSDLEDNLVEVGEETSYVKIFGFVGTPEVARKSRGDQHFFVNLRFIKSHYLNHAVCEAFKPVIPADKFPFYCIFLQLDPKHVDINIHPTKTEVKFDDEQTIYRLLSSIVKKGISGMLNMPELPFDKVAETIRATPPNPKQEPTTIGQYKTNFRPQQNTVTAADWEKLFEVPSDIKSVTSRPVPSSRDRYTPPQTDQESETIGMFQRTQTEGDTFIVQLKNTFILTQVKSGLLVIDQNHAHQRILFEQFLKAEERPPLASQQLLFPKNISFSAADFGSLMEVENQLRHLGFDLKQFGENTLIVHGVPAELSNNKVEALLEEIISEMRDKGHSEVDERVFAKLAKAIAVKSAIPAGKKLNHPEMRSLVDQLFNCEHPGITPSGKPTFQKQTLDQLMGHFGRK